MSQTAVGLIERVQLEAANNSDFARRLEADPKGAIESMLGGQLPGGINIRVVRQSPTEITIVLPPQPNPARELSDAELERVAGGAKYCWSTTPLCWDTKDCIFFTA